MTINNKQDRIIFRRLNEGKKTTQPFRKYRVFQKELYNFESL